MASDLLPFRRRWWGFYVLFPALQFTAIIILILANQRAAETGETSKAIAADIVCALVFVFCVSLYAPYTFFPVIRYTFLAVFLLYIWYAVSMLFGGKLIGSSRSDASFTSALGGLIFWGAPSLLMFLNCRRPKFSPYDERGRALTVAEIVRRNGFLYIGDVLDGLAERLPTLSYSLIAAACAERLHARAECLFKSKHTQPSPGLVFFRQFVDHLWLALQTNAVADALKTQLEAINPGQPNYKSDLTVISKNQLSTIAAASLASVSSYIDSSPDAALATIHAFLTDSHGSFEEELLSNTHALLRSKFLDRCCSAQAQQDLAWLKNLLKESATTNPTPSSIHQTRASASA